MGTLTPGKLANLIAVPGTVDSTFQALHQVKLVLNRGTVIKDQLPRQQ
jgi:imidazolonepropionase-like amidohydrolase